MFQLSELVSYLDTLWSQPVHDLLLFCGLQDKVDDLELQLRETIIESETSECSLLERISVCEGGREERKREEKDRKKGRGRDRNREGEKGRRMREGGIKGEEKEKKGGRRERVYLFCLFPCTGFQHQS